jgi:transcriptional regulator with AAA-type ATPase domain/ferredoxin
MESRMENVHEPLPARPENPEEILLFLSRVPLFQTLSRSSLDQIVHDVHVESYPKGTPLIRQGDPGDSFYILRSGEARVTTTSEDGLESYLATLSAGDCLGEMALLTGEPRAANVTLSADSVLYCLYKDDFDQILSRNPILYRHFTSLLVQRLKGSNLLVEREREREAALSRFLHLDPAARSPELVGRSRPLQDLQARLRDLADRSAPLILRGERGVGKALVARLIHQMGPAAQGPFVVATCLPERRKRQTAIPRDRRRRDQLACHLFGYERGAFPGALARQIGILELAHEGTLLIRNAEHLSPSLLHAMAQIILCGSFQRVGGTRSLSIQVRVILTWSDGQSPEKEQMLAGFAGEVGARDLPVPPLRERRKDIPLLVDHFISAIQRPTEDEGGLRLSKEALNRLMHYDFPGNVAELESVIKRGMLLARGPEIFPEEILLGVPRVEGKTKFNLLRIPWVKRLVDPVDLVGYVRLGATAALLAMIPLALWGLELRAAGEPLVLLLTWKVWWPLLLLSLFLAGRIWCGVCPVYTIAGIAQRWRQDVPIPEAVARWGRWMAIGGFFILVWVENYFQTMADPRKTGFLLMGVVLGAILVGLVFQRNAWCRYLCPLGTMASVYAISSCAEVRANRSLCLSSCTEHSCYKGRADRPGCPMYQHPLFFQSNMNCRFCLQCVGNCPHGAVQLNLRVPGEEAWTMEDRPLWAALFARMLEGFVLFQCLHRLESLQRTLAAFAASTGIPPALLFTAFMLLPVAAVLGLHAVCDALTRLETSFSFRRTLEIYGFAGVPLALLGHLALKLGESTGPVPSTMILFGRYFVQWDLLRVLQALCLLLGTLLSLHLVTKLERWVRTEAARGGRWASTLQGLPLCLMALLFWVLLGLN